MGWSSPKTVGALRIALLAHFCTGSK